MSSTPAISFFANTDRGLMRERNEDAYLALETPNLYAVADGLGGLPDGDVASETAISCLQSLAATVENGAEFDMPNAFNQAHEAVRMQAIERAVELGIATTLTTLFVQENKAHIGHVGDSALYRLRAGKLEQLTDDHTLGAQIRKEIPPSEYGTIPEYYDHTLTRCIGQEGDLEPDFLSVDIEPGDRFLLSSDGVSKTWELPELKTALSQAQSPEAMVENLIKTANSRGGPDNVTAVAIFVAA